MSTCDSKEACSFFNNQLGGMKSLISVMKKRYCEADRESCARYRIKSMLNKGYALPDEEALSSVERDLNSMYPNDLPKADKIISMMVQ